MAGVVYRDEAAELMAAAARNPASPAQRSAGQQTRRAPPLVQPESRRPLPYPEPIGVNDNPESDFEPPRRRLSIPRLLARILIAPLYLAVAIAAVGILWIFARGFIGF